MLVEDKLDMYLDMEDMDDSDYAIKENEPLVKQRLRSEKRETRVKNSSRKNKRKQFTAKRLREEPTEEEKLRHSQLIDENLDMYIDMKNMEEMDEMDALNSEESRNKPRVYMIGYFYSHNIYLALIWFPGAFLCFKK